MTSAVTPDNGAIPGDKVNLFPCLYLFQGQLSKQPFKKNKKQKVLHGIFLLEQLPKSLQNLSWCLYGKGIFAKETKSCMFMG